MNGQVDNTAHRRARGFFNRVVYPSLAGLYNAMDWLTLGVWWRLLSRALDYIPPGGRVLEVGFGPGKLHERLAEQADLCAGADLAFGMCRFTQQRLIKAGLTPRITCADVHHLPYAANTFDTITSTFALSGIPDGAHAMQEMARVLRPGGCVVLVDIGLPIGGNPFGIFWARLWELMGDFLYDQPTLMRRAGLTVTVFKEYGPGEHIRAVVGRKGG